MMLPKFNLPKLSWRAKVALGLMSIAGLVIIVGVLTIVIRAWWATPLPVLGVFGAGTDAPKQPIPFSHQLHAGQLNTDCTFCHRNADKGEAATIPSVEQCMFCHRIVGTGKPGVEQLRATWEAQQPIEWKRVYRLPDHVQFVHEPHIRLGFDCAVCHGQVKNMVEVKPVRALKMRDCVDCHRKNNAATDCVICHY